ncbi:MAG: hypothetical protein FWB74_00605 [Defluviitaleaceae bacterium]|nr:hypothetical protein [Defluviitaleaceae bacterium]
MKFQLFPRSQGITDELMQVIDCFKAVEDKITSAAHELSSNEVLAYLAEHFIALGYKVEKGKKAHQKIKVPVLFGLNNDIDKEYNADALSPCKKIVVEVEAGRAVDNNQYLKDIFQACLMHEVEYLVLAVRNVYRKKKDFETVYTFLETLYLSGRIKLPLKGVLLIGY